MNIAVYVAMIFFQILTMVCVVHIHEHVQYIGYRTQKIEDIDKHLQTIRYNVQKLVDEEDHKLLREEEIKRQMQAMGFVR